MKRMTIISILLALVVAAGVTESALSSSLYKRMSQSLGEVIATTESGSNEDAAALAAKTVEEWNAWRGYARATSNHATVRSFEDRLYTLCAYAEQGSREDIAAYAESAKRLADDLADETYVILSNLL